MTNFAKAAKKDIEENKKWKLVTEYMLIVSDGFVENFEKKVNAFLKDGWECQGGIGVFIKLNGAASTTVKYQAMIRTKRVKKELDI